MIIPDVNLLYYIVNQSSPEHVKAFSWWKKALENNSPIGIYSSVGYGFIRLCTNPRISPNPLTSQEAYNYLDHWCSFPHVTWIESHPDLYDKTKELFIESQGGSNLLTDAQIAAVSLLFTGTVYSNDTDFQRFPKLKWKNPLS